MAIHAFGIMHKNPGKERYDQYEPEKYILVPVEDEAIEPIWKEWDQVLCYWHTRLRPERNLAYCGITLIPPESAKAILEGFKKHNDGQVEAVIALFAQAVRENKYVIHYGL